MVQRICAECGNLFEATSNRFKYCNGQHYRRCSVCGKLFPISKDKLSTDLKTCSEACRRASISKTASEHGTMLTLVCQECGATYQSYYSYPRICSNQHFRICKVCGRSFEVTTQQIITNIQTCSQECRYKLVQSTVQDKYGVDNVFQSENVHMKYEATMQNKYGVSNPMQDSAIKMKAHDTTIKRYGVDSFTQTEEYKRKTIETSNKRYGVDWHAQTSEHKEAIVSASLKKYGTTNPSKSTDVVKMLVTDCSKIDQWKQFHDNPRDFIRDHFPNSKPTLSQLGDMCGILDSSVEIIIDRSDCKELVQYHLSKMEDEVLDFILSLIGADANCVRKTRKVISPYELDLYFPDYHIGIECNPTATHNSSVCDPWGSIPKSSKYHQLKTEMCDKSGIQLFHIFGYEWTHKQEIVKSMLRNLFHRDSRNVYARNTEVRELPADSCRNFLSNNHRQGAADSPIRLGLFVKDSEELISVMTFGKMQNSIGTSNEDLSNCYELVRFCNLFNTSVVGGASKLFKHFVSQYQPAQIRSFSDRAHTSGKLYVLLGFNEVRRSEPGYVWVNMKTDTAYHRSNAQKRNLKKFLHDESIDLSKTETEIMTDHGFVQVFDSGTITWEWKSN